MNTQLFCVFLTCRKAWKAFDVRLFYVMIICLSHFEDSLKMKSLFSVRRGLFVQYCRMKDLMRIALWDLRQLSTERRLKGERNISSCSMPSSPLASTRIWDAKKSVKRVAGVFVVNHCCRWYIDAEFVVFFFIGVCESSPEGKASEFWANELMLVASPSTTQLR